MPRAREIIQHLSNILLLPGMCTMVILDYLLLKIVEIFVHMARSGSFKKFIRCRFFRKKFANIEEGV